MEDGPAFPKPVKQKRRAAKRIGTKMSTSSRRKMYRVLVRPAYLAGLAAGQGRRGQPPLCERCGHERRLSIHHTQGRDGDLLLRPNRLAALCDPCHAEVHANPVLAREAGWMVSRVATAEDGSEPPAE